MRYRFTRDFYIPKGSVKVADKGSDAVAYVYTNSRGRPTAAVFYGKQAKPVFHYNYRTDAEREKSVARAFAARKASADSRAEYATKEAALAAEHRSKVQVGDIYRTCWGYDQTNVEFFEVVEVKGAYAILREIACASRSAGMGSDRVVPQSGSYLAPRHEGDDRGQPIRRLIQSGRIKIDYFRTGWPWGTRVAGVVVGESVHRTADGWGH